MLALKIIGLVIIILFLSFSFFSLKENEKRASILFLFSAALFTVIYFVFPMIYEKAYLPLLGFTIVLFGMLFILFLPVDHYRAKHGLMPEKQIDERDTMFSRKEIQPGTNDFQDYYYKNPDKKTKDDKFRKKPGLLSKDSQEYHPFAFSAAEASFQAVKHFYDHLTGTKGEKIMETDPQYLSTFLIKWTKKLGALDAGICELKNFHWYSYKGRGKEYGNSIEPEHKYALAFIVGMDKEMVDAAPSAAIIMESGQQYLESGSIAIHLAHFLRNMGWDARAHIDGNYQVVCPLVARDAGLGEIGRMGLLMTPKLGPRVRIAVVTTNVPLEITKKRGNSSVEHFCKICKKCAYVCPGQSIYAKDFQIIDGVKRWQINSESCFTYWCTIGTDCGQCIRVCPYAHPDNLMHGIIRWGIRHSYLFRYFALKMDDVFYGKKPKSKKMPDWILCNQK